MHSQQGVCLLFSGLEKRDSERSEHPRFYWMGRGRKRKLEEDNIRSLTKTGGTSYAVTIPMEFILKLKWREKQKLEVKLYQDRIIIRDWKKRYDG